MAPSTPFPSMPIPRPASTRTTGRFGRLGLLVLLAALCPARAEDGDAKNDDADKKEEKKLVAIAVIVHPDNPVKKISLSDLRGYFKMDRQFWPNKKRCEVFLPPQKTTEYAVLLDVVYRMSHKKLQKYWVRKLFSGEIPAKPSFVPTPGAAGKRVNKAEGAIAVVPADEVPKGVRVLLIDNKKPGDKGYPLVGKPVTEKPKTP